MVSTRVTPNSEQIPVNIVGGSQFGFRNKINASRTYNMYVSLSGDKEQADAAWLVNYPGYHRVLNILPYPDPYPSNPTYYPNQVPVGSGRGMFNCTRGDFAIVVVNAIVYRLSPNLNLLQVGTLATNAGEVFIAENLNSQVCIVDGVNAYIYDYSLPGGNLTIQTDGALGTGSLIPNYVEYHNSFFLFGNANTTTAGAFWYAYKYNTNGAVDDAIVQQSQLALQTKADYALAVKKLPGQANNVIVFGSTVAELWNQAGGLQNYIRIQDRNINYGCVSVSTIADSGDTIAWLGINEEEAPEIMAYSPAGLQRISTDGIDYQLSLIQFPQDSTAMLYRQGGHLFYQLTFYNKADNLTLLYDFDTKLFFNLTDQYMNYHPARGVIYFNNLVYFLSLNNAALYEMDADFDTIDENLYPITAQTVYNYALNFTIPRERITNSIRQANATRFRANSLSLTLEQGTDVAYTGAASEQTYNIITQAAFTPPLTDTVTEGNQYYIVASGIPGSNDIDVNFNPNLPYTPFILCAISKDGGVTWSNWVRRDLHQLAHRQNMLHWENMGVANDLTLKFQFNVNNDMIICNGVIDIVL
jgi:hypothetical protein